MPEDVEKIRASSWTGSENSRKEQGVCLPPAHPPNTTPRFSVKQGTTCAVTPVSCERWRWYVTTKELGFERYERFVDWHYEFRLEGWLMRVHCSRVDRRE